MSAALVVVVLALGVSLEPQPARARAENRVTRMRCGFVMGLRLPTGWFRGGDHDR
jgi:hypothetical protein